MSDTFTPSGKAQWNERGDKPIASKYETKRDIESFQHVLANFYQCDPNDISWGITCDSDSTDWVLLHYQMRTKYLGKTVNRKIFQKKMPVPENLKKMIGEKKQKQQVPGSDVGDRKAEYYNQNQFTFEPCEVTSKTKVPVWTPRAADLDEAGWKVDKGYQEENPGTANKK